MTLKIRPNAIEQDFGPFTFPDIRIEDPSDGTLIHNIGRVEVVFNEDGVDRDFRVETLNQANMFFVDGGNDRVAVRADGAGIQDLFRLTNYRGVSQQDNDGLKMEWIGSDDGGIATVYGEIKTIFSDVSGGVEKGSMIFSVQNLGSLSEAFSIYRNTTVFNEDGEDRDFRVESDSYANMFQVNGGNNAVQIGTATAGSIAYFYNSGIIFNEAGLDRNFRVESNIYVYMLHVDSGTNTTSIGTSTKGAIAAFGNTGVVFNEDSQDRDFRVESDGNANMLFVDAGNDRVGIGTNSPKTDFTIDGTLTLKEQASADADTAAYGQLWVKTATPNQLWFTDDAGTDAQLGTGGGYTEGARVKSSANQNIPNHIWTLVAFTAEDYDTDDMHDNVTNNSRLTVKTAGKYFITGNVRWQATAGGTRDLWCVVNGDTVIESCIELNPTAPDSAILRISTIYDLEVNDYVELKVHHDQGSTQYIRYSVAYSPIFVMQRIG